MAEIIKLDDIRVAKEDMAQIQSIHGMKQFADKLEDDRIPSRIERMCVIMEKEHYEEKKH